MLIVSAVVAMLLALLSSAAAEPRIQVFINSAHAPLPRPPIVSASVVMMPLHDVLAHFEGGASWDPRSGLITVGVMPRGATTPFYVELRLGQSDARIKDKRIPLEAPPVFVEGWIYVPLTFFRDALGANVDWDEIMRTVYINVPPSSPLLGMRDPPPRYLPRILPAPPGLVVRVDTHRRPLRILIIDSAICGPSLICSASKRAINPDCPEPPPDC